jgi:shikimate dehydrogenase
MRISAKNKICMIIGDPIEHSLSPRMHNAVYEALSIDDEFIFVGAHVKVEDVGQVVAGIKAMGIRGLTCTIPHKIEVMKFLDEENIDPVARKIGAVNTIVNDNGVLKGYNTDWLGVLTPLEQVTSLKGKKVAVLGAGGTARAMVYAVTSRGAFCTVYNRTLDKAEQLAEEFGGAGKSLDDVAEVTQADIILNATSLGMHPQEKETPLPKEYLREKHIVFDAIYVPYETWLLQEAKEQGAQIIHGLDMLLYQGLPQFELYTNRKGLEDVMRKVLMSKFQ